jgi:hypothetical protein
MGLYCGIDLHSNNHVLTVLDDARQHLPETALPVLEILWGRGPSLISTNR